LFLQLAKDHYLFECIYVYIFSFVTKFQNYGSEHEHGTLWIKKTPMYRVHTNEKIEQFVDMMYISCDVLLLPNPLQNAQQH
jgi:hypothetical protein